MHVEKRCKKKKKEETINYENNEDCRINREKKKVFLESILSILIVENRKFIRSSMLKLFYPVIYLLARIRHGNSNDR